MSLETALQVIGVTIAILTFWQGLREYTRQGASKRAEQFLLMRSRLRENRDYQQICELLELNSPELAEIELIKKDNFIGFYEELTLLWNSRIFSDQIVFYMFGYYALRCWRSRYFWAGLNREQQVWAHFRDFVERMEVLEKNFQPSRRKYRL